MTGTNYSIIYKNHIYHLIYNNTDNVFYELDDIYDYCKQHKLLPPTIEEFIYDTNTNKS